MSVNTEKVTLSYPKSLARRAERFKGQLKYSAIWTAALEAEVEKLEEAARQHRMVEASAAALEDARNEPLLTPRREIPTKYNAYLSEMLEYEAEAWKASYLDTMGTISTWKYKP